jgi:hypothetical protein
MRTPVQLRKAWKKIIVALALFDYLTASQVTRLLYAPSSLKHVQEQMKSLVDTALVTALGGRTVSSKGRQYAAGLGAATGKRFRPSEEQEKGHNPYFLKHTMAVTDVLIGARLLSQTVPGIVLNRMYTERELRGKIYVEMPIEEGNAQHRTICIEPDASCDFTIQGKWQDFFHIEVYSNLPPAEWRFKQKIQGYVTYTLTGQHEALFATPALSIAVFAQTPEMATTLKRWTEEALREMERPQEGNWFFFCSLSELFLSPVWEQAFSDTKTPLLVLDEEHND